MNKQELINSKHRIIFIGSARGVNRFYITNKFIEEFPQAKVINTGSLIQTLIKRLDLQNLDTISIYTYFKYIEPMLLDTILAHLEHGDVILDTTFYYLLPGISVRGLLEFQNRIIDAILVLVEDSDNNIFKTQNQDIEWFKDIQNIKNDLMLNRYSYDSYLKVFSDFIKTYSITLSLDSENMENTLNMFIQEVKNGS